MLDRKQILSSSACGCFYCLKTFTPDDIAEWVDVDEVSGLGMTALCPHCGVDSVIGFPSNFNDVTGYLKRRNMQSFEHGGKDQVRYGKLKILIEQNNGWSMVGIGAIALIFTSFLILHGGNQTALSPLAFPVTIPAIMLGKGVAVAIPSVLFVIYNVIILRFKMTKVSTPGLTMTGFAIATIAFLSFMFYTAGWKYRGVYVHSATVNAWVFISCLLVAATVFLFITAIRERTPHSLVIAHIALFVWFFTYAFPWLGESI